MLRQQLTGQCSSVRDTFPDLSLVPGPLNPYEQFKNLQPVDVIQHAVFVFNGHFELPLAAAIAHAQKAQNLLAAKRTQEALADAQQAVSLAPDAVSPNATLGDVLSQMGRRDEARQSYQRALASARTVEPEFQIGSALGLESKLQSQ
jgi:tetratricopeptide (TPR) repeat protein